MAKGVEKLLRIMVHGRKKEGERRARVRENGSRVAQFPSCLCSLELPPWSGVQKEHSGTSFMAQTTLSLCYGSLAFCVQDLPPC